MFPTAPQKSVFYEDYVVYACLAQEPLTHGHSIVVWKQDINDLHLLSEEEYEHLMDVVNHVRDALIEELGVEKVYLIYMDEAKHVHWHLIPRYNEMGYNVFQHQPRKINTFPLAKPLKERLDIDVGKL